MPPFDDSATATPPVIAVIGSLTIDHTFIDGQPAPPRYGGVVTYAGLTYRRLGNRVRIAFNAGPANCAPSGLLRAGVELLPGTCRATTRFENALVGDERRQRLLARADPIRGEQITAAAVGSRLVHLGPLHPDDIVADDLASIGLEQPVALDLQGYCRQVAADGAAVETVLDPRIHRLINGLFALKLDRIEMTLLCDATGVGPAQLAGSCGIGEVIETRGRAGGVVWPAAGDPIPWLPPPSEDPTSGADSTGAGDVFFAAYLHHRIRGAGIQTAVVGAARVAADQVGGRFIDGASLSI